ncbi:MAG: dTMP kinase [Deltaproteobacteria bacterium]|nr:dTMP kinase [Deltaproteobacteria bacterium]
MPLFVSFEGIEGSGKTTQFEYLAGYLKNKGFNVVKTREPGGSRLGERVRAMLLKEEINISPQAELFLIMAQRAQHVEEVILPALSQGKFVICDRFIDATVAYQGYGRGLDLELIRYLNGIVTRNVTPHLTILLDCDIETGLKRKGGIRGGLKDRFEKEQRDFHERVRKGYLEIAACEKGRVRVIDGNREKNLVREEVIRSIEEILANYGIC